MSIETVLDAIYDGELDDSFDQIYSAIKNRKESSDWITMAIYSVEKGCSCETFVFKWEGGAYIDVSRPYGEAFDCINVWDYTNSRPEISTRKEVSQLANEWLKDYAADFVRNGY